jgi:histone-lysine N-methyltransferase SETMAR
MNEVLLLHDDARPYTILRSGEAITTMGKNVLLHHPYSPDLAPSNFHLSGLLAWTLSTPLYRQ